MTWLTKILGIIAITLFLAAIWSYDQAEQGRCFLSGCLFAVLAFGSWVHDDITEYKRRNDR